MDLSALCPCGFVSWIIAAFLVYKILDRLIRLPFVRGRDTRHILVTGCDTGFGHEITKRLDASGCHVIAGCFTEKGETDLKQRCSNKLRTIRLDVSKHDSVLQAYEQVKAMLPRGQGLWGIMNNAGIAGNVGPVEWLTRADYDAVLDVNLHGVVDVTTTFLPLVKKARGRVVSTASVFGRTVLLGSSPYVISKYGVEAFSDTLRKQMRDYGCSVHLIEPGFHKTNIASPQNLERSLTNTWERLSPELRQEYGDEYFQQSKEAIVYKFVDRVASDRISDVVDAYEHALLGLFPRARYVVGNDARFFWLPVQWMPEWLGDLVQETLAGKDRPIPAILKSNH